MENIRFPNWKCTVCARPLALAGVRRWALVLSETAFATAGQAGRGFAAHTTTQREQGPVLQNTNMTSSFLLGEEGLYHPNFRLFNENLLQIQKFKNHFLASSSH